MPDEHPLNITNGYNISNIQKNGDHCPPTKDDPCPHQVEDEWLDRWQRDQALGIRDFIREHPECDNRGR